jgi:glycosyltransferase involved in cell wall biosynthesis
MSIAVITGTTGARTLRDTILSVHNQTVPVHHWIIVDGIQYESSVRKTLEKLPKNDNRHVLVLPENTGGSGYLCHRINGALPWLVNTDYVCFLDEDNMFMPTHIEHMMRALRDAPGARWAHAFRNIIDDDDTIVCPDSCESLGGLSHTVLDRNDRLIDTNCYVLERELAVQISPLWNVKARQQGRLEADRHVCQILLRQEPIYGVSHAYSVLYRVSGRSDSVNAEFFKQGNAFLGRGVGGYDATKPTMYLFHFDRHRTAEYCHGEFEKDPLSEWCPGMWHGLCSKYNIVDGFACLEYLPRNAWCLVAMCSPDTLPLDVFASRPDLTKILYTAEGPNIRHAAQWDISFLKKHFDIVLTHWQPLLDSLEIKTVFCPHNARFLEFPRHSSLCRTNTGSNKKSVVMVLERRDLLGTYDINGVTLKCLDCLREQYVTGLSDITVYGDGWTSYCETHPHVTLGYSMPRHMDTNTPIDHYQHHDFALIVENCDAEGYVSEKFGDALLAGAIPLYYGNPSDLVPLPDGAYIDIRKFTNGHELQNHLESLTDDDITRMKLAVSSVRQEYLQKRGRETIARAVLHCRDEFPS